MAAVLSTVAQHLCGIPAPPIPKPNHQLVDHLGRKSLSCCVFQKDFFFLKREVVTCSLFVCCLFYFFFLFGQFYNCFLSLICYLDSYFNSSKGSSWSQTSHTGCVFNSASFQLFFQLWSQHNFSSSCPMPGFLAIGKLRQMPGRHRFAMQCFSFTFSSIMWSLKFSQRHFEHKAWIKSPLIFH